MQLKNTFERYGAVAKGFHWVLALLIIFMLTVGLRMTSIESLPDKFWVYGLHKSTGIVVLFLVVLRLGWKLANVAPMLPAHMRKIEVFLAQCGHLALYGFMFAMPLSGWIMSNAAGFPVSVYGLFVVPNLVEADKPTFALFQDIHKFLGWGLIVMTSLHVLAALLHHFVHKDNVLRRMLPFSKGVPYAQDSDTATGC